MTLEIVCIIICAALIVTAFFMRKNPVFKKFSGLAAGLVPLVLFLLVKLFRSFGDAQKKSSAANHEDALRNGAEDIRQRITRAQEKSIAVEAAALEKIEQAKRRAEEASRKAAAFNKRSEDLAAMRGNDQVDEIINDLKKE